MRKRVLFISHDASRTGAPMVLLHLLRWLNANTDLSFDVLLGRGGELAPQFDRLARVFYSSWEAPSRLLHKVLGRLRGGNRALPARIQRHLVQQLARRDIGLIYSNTVVNGVTMNALAGLNCPMLCHVHELYHWITFETNQQVFQLTKKFTQHYIAASRAVKDNLVSNHGIPPTWIDVVHEFIPIELLEMPAKQEAKAEACRRLGLSPNVLLVGGCGTMDWRKGVDLLVPVARTICQRFQHAPVHFLWIGGATGGRRWGRLMHDVQRCGLANRVHFLGTLPNPSELFAALDVYTLTSREDPYPLVMLEAAAAGNPIVCFDQSGGAREFVEHDAGIVVPYIDTQAMGNAVVCLLRDESLRRRLGERASQKVRQRHDVRAGASEVYNIILKLLEQPARQIPTRKAA